ncbi:DUF7281 domain-containing protein [Arcticibacter eurypsychrophilus]|uniref:DUF7281 domain-containing protein n=1 Tax=Arcticibacter eurypsychrophilus TaxID=1434752 RepID=UPI00084DE970|nr:hypothetical protein [Arcticibacter eurypsychrophilus]
MKLSKSLAIKLLQLSSGERVPASQLKYPLISELLEDGILVDIRSGRTKSVMSLQSSKSLQAFLLNRFSIADLNRYVETLNTENLSRSLLVQVASNSKISNVRTFKGFLVNSYEPVSTTLNGISFLVQPPSGTFQFIHEFEQFIPHPDVTIVGIENSESFSQIDRQRHLFKGVHPLFVSRYPQNQSKDLIKWLQTIPNNYLHFGDFDFAGIGIYLNEYKRYLGSKARFLVPDTIETMLSKYGKRGLYDNQKMNFEAKEVQEEGILKLLKWMHQYKKGLEQEAFIER